ncbi:MAG: PKD domain-containing protein [Bacteroidetes bacterium]|nr:PKD domain-containing protein [Bacteroidota bacterium]
MPSVSLWRDAIRVISDDIFKKDSIRFIFCVALYTQSLNAMKYIILPILLACMTCSLCSGQSLQPPDEDQYRPDEYPAWIDLMNDPSVNFYDVKQAFDEYFADRPKDRGTGWKQFKRWEWFMGQRVYPTGNRVNPSQAWEEISKFRKSYPAEKYRTNSNWTELGPFTYLNNTGHWSAGLGRINVIARHPYDSLTFYIGSPSGGCWKTTDQGEHWMPLTDFLPAIGVSAIAIDPDNPETVYIGTGDKDNADTYSIGILKSTDGGYTWETTGLTWSVAQFRNIAKILINPHATSEIFAATSAGLYKSTDAGNSWYSVLSGDIDDIEFRPGNPDIVYAVTKKFYRSIDGGETFTQTTGLPTNFRVQIAVTDARPDWIYFFSSQDGIYRSENGGLDFTKRSSQPNPGVQDWYDLAMDVSDVNPEEVHIGEVITYRSLDGAQTWTLTTDWTWNNPIGYTHCDIHEMVFYGGTLYVGSDGLICKTTDAGDTWTDFSVGLNIRQFYRIGCSQNNPYKILGGSQDNGTSVYSYDYWHEWLGADGMECAVNYLDENIVYGTSQFGNFYKSIAGGNFGNVDIAQPGGGGWITPFVMHPTNPDILFVGNTNVRKTTDGMMSWTTISSLGNSEINGLAISQSNPDYLYVSKSANIYRTSNGGSEWVQINNGLPNIYITYIAIHPSDPKIVAISLSGYTAGEKVYITYDAGNTWENISGNLPNIPANCVVFADDPLNPLYVGMDVGVYYRDNTLTEWEPFMTSLPDVIVDELEIHHASGMIRAGTYGRGLWESPIHASVPTAAFTCNQTTIPVACSVDFTSLSSGIPETLEWHFEGGTPETSNEKNPSGIIYYVEGSYDVTLTVINDLGTNTLTKEDYITVSSTLLPGTNFSADDSIVCSNQNIITFNDLTIYCPNAWNWSIDPGTITFMEGTNASSQNPVVRFDENGTYTVTLTASNVNGSQALVKNDYISIGGLSLPFAEDFEAPAFRNGWTIINPDAKITWELADVGGNTPGNKAARVNIYNYTVPPGQRDRLISPPFNLTGYGNAYLSFQHAYAKRYFQITDSLIIYISDNCGSTWTRIFAGGDNGSGSFATHELTTDEFIPAVAEDWCGGGYGSECNILDISAWTGQSDVQIMFETYNYLGNNIYIDNITVTNAISVDPNTPQQPVMDIYPNPSTDQIHISIRNVTGEVEVELMNLQAQVIQKEKIAGHDGVYSESLDLANYPKGIYLIRLIGHNWQKIQKVVIK